jgi:hypothetical protein
MINLTKKQFDKNILKKSSRAKEFVNDKYNLSAGNNINLVCEKLYNNLPGAYVECGVFKGNTFFVIAEFIKQNGITSEMYGFDTFSGFPSDFEDEDRPEQFKKLIKSGLIDEEHYEKAADRTDNFTNCSHLKKEYFELSFEDVCCVAKNYEFSTLIRGEFSDTLSKFDKDISVLFIDCDLYKSYLECFVLFDKVLPGGAVVFDEYYSLKYPGAILAVQEFFADKPGWLEEYETPEGFKRVCFVKEG